MVTLSTPWSDITDFLDSVPQAVAAAKAPEEQYYVHAVAERLWPDTTCYYSRAGRRGGIR